MVFGDDATQLGARPRGVANLRRRSRREAPRHRRAFPRSRAQRFGEISNVLLEKRHALGELRVGAQRVAKFAATFRGFLVEFARLVAEHLRQRLRSLAEFSLRASDSRGCAPTRQRRARPTRREQSRDVVVRRHPTRVERPVRTSDVFVVGIGFAFRRCACRRRRRRTALRTVLRSGFGLPSRLARAFHRRVRLGLRNVGERGGDVEGRLGGLHDAVPSNRVRGDGTGGAFVARRSRRAVLRVGGEPGLEGGLVVTRGGHLTHGRAEGREGGVGGVHEIPQGESGRAVARARARGGNRGAGRGGADGAREACRGRVLGRGGRSNARGGLGRRGGAGGGRGGVRLGGAAFAVRGRALRRLRHAHAALRRLSRHVRDADRASGVTRISPRLGRRAPRGRTRARPTAGGPRVDATSATTGAFARDACRAARSGVLPRRRRAKSRGTAGSPREPTLATCDVNARIESNRDW